MSSITTDESSYGSHLWRQPSVMSAASSNLTSSSGADSCISMDSGCMTSTDQLSFLTHRSENYHQLMDDLAIIDEIYQTFDDEVESEPYERQVADAARNVAQKKSVADQMCQSEQQHINDMLNFERYYLTPINEWINDPANAGIFAKYPGLCSKPAMNNLFADTAEMTLAHQNFCRVLKERLDMWGPTQFISDIFAHFYDKLNVYETFLNGYPNTIVTIDSLYTKSATFPKYIENYVSQANNPTVKDLVYYLKSSISRLSSYSIYVTELASATEPSHPDYQALNRIKDKFVQREKQWKTIVKDRLGHVRVLEASRSIQGNIAVVNIARRLYISSVITQVDLTEPHSTADTRTYVLYNDMLIYCQKIKSYSKKASKSGSGGPVKLQFKGIISLKVAEVLPLSAKTIAKISEVKKHSALSSFMRKSEPQTTAGPRLVYGFELKVQGSSDEVMGLGDNYVYPMPTHGPLSIVKRTLIMRTQTEAEQNAWMTLIRRVHHNVTRKR
ncbi:Dbl homology domain-containing protein [Mucor mucedo]|uniref:Dbl homology domain-containing protein n=1 Tax=Mucor mucedo TaxID=29922 RepID=UPI00221FACA3|nr:Dbl homology domain-containing protein [Mucor mucedo]KAI7881726.1 Dbl homology domain-containing protein [Mucor mucedo]